MQLPGEKDLIGKAAGGDHDAFEALYRAHHPQIHSIVSRRVRDGDDARDLVQTVFIRALRNLPKFRADAAFSTWLVRIAINTCNSYARSWWMRRVSLDQMEDPESTLQEKLQWPGEGPEDSLCRREDRAIVRSRIRALPHRYRQPMWMRHVEDLPYAKIANRLGLAMGTVKTQLHRGFQTLKADLASASIPN